MSSLRSVFETVAGLLVEDGSLAVGIVAALGVTWLAAALLPETGRDQIGWLLLVLLLALVLINVRSAGLRAKRIGTAPGH